MMGAQVQIHVSYERLDGEGVRSVTVDAQGTARPADAARELGISVVRTVGVARVSRRVSVCPKADVRIREVGARIEGCGLLDADALFLNGYNSWTDAVERDPKARMRGLAGVPRAMVDRWVLDNSGDYRFTAQDVRAGHQHGFGYGYVRKGDQVLLVGSLDEDSGFTLIRESLPDDALSLEKEPPAKPLDALSRCEVLSFCLCEGTLDKALDLWLGASGITARPAQALVGYSSWYRHYGDISSDKLSADLEATGATYAARDLDPCLPVFQIDDGYALVGDWTSPDAGRFPDGMAPFAREAEERGLLPGIWLAPFLCERESKVASAHPDWLLRDDDGGLAVAAGNWSGAYALDTLNPDVRAHITEFMSVVTRTWGYRLLKLDFLFGACLVPHGGLNRGQLMADALDLLRSSVPEGTLFDLCGVPLMSAFGRTEYCRVGPDVGLDWDDVPYMRLLHRERVSTKRNLANTRGRAHLDRRVFRNDPDVFFLRDDVKLTDEQRYALLRADATLGGVFFTSDDMASWDEGQRISFEEGLKSFVDKERWR